MSEQEQTETALAPSMSATDFDALLAAIAPQYQTESDSMNPLLGYGDPYLVAPKVDTADRVLLDGARPPLVERRDEVRFTDVVDILSSLDNDDKDGLAIELFGAGLYDDINDMFDDNFKRDEIVFNQVVENAINLARQGTELGFETTFLKVLMGAGSSDTNTVMKSIAEAKARAAEEKKKGGRVIQWANPQALVRSLKEESKSTLGRTASKREQQQFVKKIHNMQAKGLSVNVVAEAEASARKSAPVEAGAMDVANARKAVMKVIMSRVGKG